MTILISMDTWWVSNLPTLNKNNAAFFRAINGSGGVLEFWDNLGMAVGVLMLPMNFQQNF